MTVNGGELSPLKNSPEVRRGSSEVCAICANTGTDYIGRPCRKCRPNARPAPSGDAQMLTTLAGELLHRAYTAEERPVTEGELRGWSQHLKGIADGIR